MRRDVVIVACAVSAGIHAALTPEHFREGIGAGGGFLAAAVSLSVLMGVLWRWPASVSAMLAATLVFAGLLSSYVLATTTGVPVLHPQAEPVDGLALATKAVEAIGLVAGLHSVRRRRTSIAQLKGATT